MLCQRLILMVTASVRKLCRGNIYDTLACSAWHLMDKAHEVLIGIAESHATSHSTLKETCRTGEIKRNHTLILAPYIHHAIEAFII